MNTEFIISSSQLINYLKNTREKTLDLVKDLSDEQLNMPLLEIVNPPLWEIGHVAFFYEAFVLCVLGQKEYTIKGAEELYNSFLVDHDDRWSLPLPSRKTTYDYMETTLNRLIDRLMSHEPDSKESYLYFLAILHEDMHVEALTYTRQTLRYSTPKFSVADVFFEPKPKSGSLPGDVEIPGCTFNLGATPGADFVFDNEKWSHPVEIKPFKIARAPVTNGEYIEFVEAGGYGNYDHWSYGGRVWLSKSGKKHPVYWRSENGQWFQYNFNELLTINKHEPVIHINWYEAEAFCNWANRRLPSEAEWELAASAIFSNQNSGIKIHKQKFPWGEEPNKDNQTNLNHLFMGCVEVGAFPESDSDCGCRQMIGNIWEWTSSPFYPFPGYILDSPYKEYSAPWFGYCKVLRGGSWATSSRLANNTYRNFFLPHRQDTFTGFRTCCKL